MKQKWLPMYLLGYFASGFILLSIITTLRGFYMQWGKGKVNQMCHSNAGPVFLLCRNALQSSSITGPEILQQQLVLAVVFRLSPS